MTAAKNVTHMSDTGLRVAKKEHDAHRMKERKVEKRELHETLKRISVPEVLHLLLNKENKNGETDGKLERSMPHAP